MAREGAGGKDALTTPAPSLISQQSLPLAKSQRRPEKSEGEKAAPETSVLEQHGDKEQVGLVL